MGFKFLFVANQSIYPVSVKRMDSGLIVQPDLAGQSVLQLTLGYQCINRVPTYIVYTNFSKVSFNRDGVLRKNALSDENRVVLNYAMHGLFSQANIPLPIPPAPYKPTKDELRIIKTYLNEKYPLLLRYSPNILELQIYKDKEQHEIMRYEMKESHC